MKQDYIYGSSYNNLAYQNQIDKKSCQVWREALDAIDSE